MKKTISLLLAIVLCLSLCACGGANGDTPATTEAAQAPTTEEVQVTTTEATEAPTEPEPIELVLGETYSLPAFDITITGFDFTQKATFPDGEGFNLLPQNGYVTANLYYDVKYTGKAAYHSSYLSPACIDYNDGYTFTLETFYYYDIGVDAWLNSGDIDPLTPEFSCKACFFVPLEVSENEEAPLFVKFFIGENEAIYTVR